MKIVFFDTMGINYDLNTPYDKPLGGTQSAVCYLLEELALTKQHELYLFSRNPNDGKSIRNVFMFDISKMTLIEQIKPDIIIACAFPDIAMQLKIKFGCSVILWSQNDYDQFPIHRVLKEKHIADIIDCFMFVSEWHMFRMVNYYNLPIEKCCVLKNGIGKPFEKYLDMDIEKEKNSMIYASTPFRGLVHHLEIIPAVRKVVPDCKLYVYSSMNTYQSNEDSYKDMYELLKKMDGIVYSEGISQTELADKMSKVEILSYPNTFPETSCITVLQAMACGCVIVSSDSGALYETTNGSSFLVHKGERYIEASFVPDFINMTKYVLNLDKEIKDEIIRKNKEFIKQNHLWKKLTNQFLDICRKVISSKNISIDHTLFLNGKFDEAYNYYNKLTTFNSVTDLVNRYINMSVCRFRITDYKGARKWMKICLKMASSFQIYRNLMVIYIALNKPHNALTYGYLALKTQDDKDIRDILSKILADINKFIIT
jgi:glycosyltransferase involved in cell wall biosynthesis